MPSPYSTAKFLREHRAALDKIRNLKAVRKDLEERLFRADGRVIRLMRQVNGGDDDPRTQPEHPGHILIMLGWQYIPGDEFGCNWQDPTNGVETYMTLAEALGIACRRLVDRLSTPPARQRLISGDDFDDG
jgi:hypothetical protein